eukprot:m.134821 g.134821  ORF g.134821 m.134821 type:complete len:91 (-) comp9743_c0_seq1:148-420(-)
MDPQMQAQEAVLKAKFGGMMGKKKKGHLSQFKNKDRAYFDSADHALSTAGVKVDRTPGNIIATPENIPKKTHAKPSELVDHTKEALAEDE